MDENLPIVHPVLCGAKQADIAVLFSKQYVFT